MYIYIYIYLYINACVMIMKWVRVSGFGWVRNVVPLDSGRTLGNTCLVRKEGRELRKG